MKDVDSSLPHRPRVLAVLPAFIPSTILTVVKPLTALHRAGQIVADITLEPWLSSRQISRADVVVFSRNTEPHALDAALAHGKPIIYDIDDNLFEIPSTYKNALPQAALAQLERYLGAADLVRAYSEPLRARMLEFNSRAQRVDCAVDWNLLPQSMPPRDPTKIRIVYATSRWKEDEMASLFMDDLRHLLSVYQDRIQLFFWGYQPPELRASPAVRFLDFMPGYDKFFSAFARSRFDIGLAPLRDDQFHRSKCNNKFREYAACRIAGVYSDVDVYSSCVENERTGMLVSGERGAWFRAISRLIEDSELRGKIQEDAFRFARERYCSEKSQAVWLAHINEVIEGNRRSPAYGAARRVEAASATGRARSLDRRMVSARASISFTARVIRRCVQLVAGIRAEGARATIQLARLYANNFCELLRIRRSLSQPPVGSRGGD